MSYKLEDFDKWLEREKKDIKKYKRSKETKKQAAHRLTSLKKWQRKRPRDVVSMYLDNSNGAR